MINKLQMLGLEKRNEAFHPQEGTPQGMGALVQEEVQFVLGLDDGLGTSVDHFLQVGIDLSDLVILLFELFALGLF